MDFGLHGGRHACRPYAASLPVRVPTVKGLFPASFGLAARLAPHDFRSAVPYGYLHRSRQDRFILRESAHAGHTGASLQACRVGIRADMSSLPAPVAPRRSLPLRVRDINVDILLAMRAAEIEVYSEVRALRLRQEPWNLARGFSRGEKGHRTESPKGAVERACPRPFRAISFIESDPTAEAAG